MQSNEIKFTSNEMKLLRNEEFLLTKRRCIQKVLGLFGKLKVEIEKSVEAHDWQKLLPFNKGDVKIARGDNYRSLPYVNMDYPRSLSKEDIFVFRSMFWWGHFYSFTLHLQGRFLKMYRNDLLNSLTQRSTGEMFISCGNSPWQYHYGSSNYKPIKDLSKQEIEEFALKRTFVKLSMKYPLFKSESEFLAAGKDAFETLIPLILPTNSVM